MSHLKQALTEAYLEKRNFVHLVYEAWGSALDAVAEYFSIERMATSAWHSAQNELRYSGMVKIFGN